MQKTSLCYIERDGKWLMLHRTKKENDINKDKWIGVGGKMEEEETPILCAIREVKEETGLKIKSLVFRGKILFCPDTPIEEMMYLFTSEDFEGEITDTCDEGELEWVKKEDVLNLPIWEGDKIFLKLIQDKEQPFFSLVLKYDEDKLTYAELDGEVLSV